MKEHKIITKLRRPLENFTAHDLDELIQAYDEVRDRLVDSEPIVDAAVKWWYSQEGSDTEFHEAVQKLSTVVGNYIKE